jgi:hypothetical protein
LTFTAAQVEALCLAVAHFVGELEAETAVRRNERGEASLQQVLDPVEDRLLFASAGVEPGEGAPR